MRVVSGIQPTGELHLGNYFGAIRECIRLQEENECFVFLADYHALTSLHNPEKLRRSRFDCACAMLALGVDPDKAAFFNQSDVPEVTELACILSTIAPLGLLQRCHAYKDKVAKRQPVNHGLLAYPVLMAADVLAYCADVVPAGHDQKQHLEVAVALAQKFNATYGVLFKPPKACVLPVAPGTDGQKMSKTYGNTIGLFEPETHARTKVMGIQTDSKRMDEPKDPATCKLYALFKLLAPERERREIEQRYAKGDIGYDEMKRRLADRIVERFAGPKRRYADLQAHPEQVQAALAKGRDKACAAARKTLDAVRVKVGL
jgi:tryptophanyl-tRNA synthetase